MYRQMAGPGDVKAFMDADGFQSASFCALTMDEQLVLRDAYWNHLNVVLQHINVAGPGARLQLTNGTSINWDVIYEEDLRAVWNEVARCLQLPESSWTQLQRIATRRGALGCDHGHGLGEA